MRNRISIVAVTVVVGILATGLSGCAANRVDLVESGAVALRNEATGKVQVAWSDAYKENNGFTVTGVLRRRDTVGSALKAHTDVTIVSPEGEVVAQARSRDIYVPRRIAGRSYLSRKRFRVHFPQMPPTGSKITVVACSRAHDDTTRNLKR